MPCSATSSDDEEVSIDALVSDVAHPLTSVQEQSLIVDIDQLQSYGKAICLDASDSDTHHHPGINQSDILKLKASGFYTVSVSLTEFIVNMRAIADHGSSGCSLSAQQAAAQNTWVL